MRKWLPSKKTAGIWLGAAVLATLSLPSPSFSPQSTSQLGQVPTKSESYPYMNVIPTMGVVDAASINDSTAKQNSTDDAKKPTSKPKQAVPKKSAPQAEGKVQQKKTPPTPYPPKNGTMPNQPPSQVPSPGSGQVPNQTPNQVPGQVPNQTPNQAQPNGAAQGDTQSVPPNPFVNRETAKLRVKVIDGRTLQPLPGAEVVVIETEQRVRTDKDGYTPYFDAPIIRNPRYRPMVAELHGQLGVIAYKNGYRDSVHLGIRIHEDGSSSETTVWMYKLGPGDTRIEPVLYEVPYHHLWLVELADKFRSKTQPGEGPERP